MLGYVLIFIGLSYIIFNEEIHLDIDKEKRLIHWKKKRLFKETQKTISFTDIKRIFVQQVGKASSFSEFYCISLELQSGDIINFAERFPSESEAEEKAQHFRKIL